MTCTLTQTDPALAGTCQPTQGTEVGLSGRADSQKVSWTHKGEYNGSPLTVIYEGTLETGRIRGTVSIPEFAVDGQFSAATALRRQLPQ